MDLLGDMIELNISFISCRWKTGTFDRVRLKSNISDFFSHRYLKITINSDDEKNIKYA